MDRFLNYNNKEIRFIDIFFKILIAFAILSAVLLFTLPINDSVQTNIGKIISSSPQKDYLAPYESVLDSILVKEGDHVKIGDTLLVISSDLVVKDMHSQQTDQQNLTLNISAEKQSVQNIKSKIIVLKRELRILAKKYENDKKKHFTEIQSLENNAFFLHKKLKVAQTKLEMDSTLFKNKVISKLQITNAYETYLGYVAEHNKAKVDIMQTKLNRNELRNTYLKNKNELKKQILTLNNDLANTRKKLLASQNNLKNSDVGIDYYDTQLNKQFIISDINGVVNQTFNVIKSSNIINKNDLLVSITPLKNKYYGKAIIHQKDLWKIKIGQDVNVKIDAYYYFEHGISKGKISFISERINDASEFYVFIDFDDKVTMLDLKSGYTFKAEIIIEKMKLWKYIFKKMFRKLQTS